MSVWAIWGRRVSLRWVWQRNGKRGLSLAVKGLGATLRNVDFSLGLGAPGVG